MILLSVFGVVSIGGLIATIVVGVAAEKYNEYGELPIPGSGVIHLPAGEVTVNFHIRGYGGRGLTLPPLRMNITPPEGGRDPQVTEDHGSTVSVNDDAHRRVWVMQVPAEGDYRIAVDGKVNGYIQPGLAFGKTSSTDGLIWVFVAMSMLSMDLAVAVWWLRRKLPKAPKAVTDPYTPTDEGIRLEQLKVIAALKESGALTEEEFDAEKRRILDGR